MQQSAIVAATPAWRIAPTEADPNHMGSPSER